MNPIEELKEKTKNIISEKSGVIGEDVASHFADKEIQRRKTAVIKAFELLEQANKEIEKASKPDLVTYDGAGGKSESFSEKRFQEAAKAKKRAEGIEQAINSALEKKEYSAVFKLTEKPDNRPSDDSSGAKE